MTYVFKPKSQDGRLVKLSEKIASLGYISQLAKLLWQTHRLLTMSVIALRLPRAFVPVVTLWVGKLIVDTVVAGGRHSVSRFSLWELLILEAGVVLGGQIMTRASSLLEGLLGNQLSNYLNIRLMEHAATLDLHNFENPTFYDRFDRARRQTAGRAGIIMQLFQLGEDLLSLISLSAMLLVYSPWLLLLLAVAVLPSFFGETHFASLEYLFSFNWAPGRRRLDYLLYLGASDKTAKEVQLFGLAGWIISRFRRLSERLYEENKRLSIRKSAVGTALLSISTAGYYAAYAVILMRAVNGVISIGSLTFLAGSFQRSRDLIQRLLLSASSIYEQALFLKDLFDFFEMKPTIVSPPAAPAVPRRIREGFVFENVGFRYPDSENWAVRHVSFQIRPGERIAFVGENGAGKTTLTKLLARLYDVTEGRILLDGKDLRSYDLDSIRRAVGVIFQDFVRYDLRFDENIGVGGIDQVRSYLDINDNSISHNGHNGHNGKVVEAFAVQPEGLEPLSIPKTIISAADKSLASSILTQLPKGYGQMLGRRFEGGVELSGGEWQKIALARAYMRDAQILILDEPTAALDARAEYEVFVRFSNLLAGRTAIIISHRFSTVRMADRIIVLKKGRVVEEGTHARLVAAAGLYAELFALQAEGYR
jgi:ATP-binding cassette subfamily B protein